MPPRTGAAASSSTALAATPANIGSSPCTLRQPFRYATESRYRSIVAPSRAVARAETPISGRTSCSHVPSLFAKYHSVRAS